MRVPTPQISPMGGDPRFMQMGVQGLAPQGGMQSMTGGGFAAPPQFMQPQRPPMFGGGGFGGPGDDPNQGGPPMGRGWRRPGFRGRGPQGGMQVMPPPGGGFQYPPMPPQYPPMPNMQSLSFPGYWGGG